MYVPSRIDRNSLQLTICEIRGRVKRYQLAVASVPEVSDHTAGHGFGLSIALGSTQFNNIISRALFASRSWLPALKSSQLWLNLWNEESSLSRCRDMVDSRQSLRVL